MFFIGGFNSIVPYVIYLTLIWTFVLFSAGGKITTWLHRNDPSSDKTLSISSEKISGKSLSSVSWNDDQSMETEENQPPGFSPEICMYIPPIPDPYPPGPYCPSGYFRGPPYTV